MSRVIARLPDFNSVFRDGLGAAFWLFQRLPSFGTWSPERAYNACATHYDSWNWQDVWLALELPIIEEFLRDVPLGSVVDIGIGTGTQFSRLSPLRSGGRLVGLDISKSMLDVARRKLGHTTELIIGDVTDLPLESRSFDAALFCRVGSHVSELNQAAAEIARVLKTNGVLIMSDIDPDHRYNATRLPNRTGKITVQTFKHSQQSWISALAEHGLHLVNESHITYDDVRTCSRLIVPNSIRQVQINRRLAYVLKFEKRLGLVH